VYSVLHFSHHRFLRHRQDIGSSLVFSAIIAFYSISQDIGLFRFFAIIAFYSIGGILVPIAIGITLRSFGFSIRIRSLSVYRFSKIKKKLTDIGLFDGSSQTLDRFLWFNQDFG
jgi:hypothetical protein